jgi:ppGpp synthetase/RelA/SpoT-type nucleotidyltranferase
MKKTHPMISETAKPYPGGSKSKVNRAGEAVRQGKATLEDFLTIDEWRAAHRAVLNTFQAILRTRTRGKSIAVAQRHKRKKTIFDKLERFPSMQLSRMDDIAGCRLIFKSVEELKKFRAKLFRARFDHKRRNESEKYDYISNPKPTGYRGIHDVYEYNVRSETGRHLKGLNIEIQYRTLVQHAWATAVEVVGFITESQPKFQKGDKRYEHAMALASEILARAYESEVGPFPQIPDRQLITQFLAKEKEIRLLSTLRGLSAADKSVTANRNAILIISSSGDLEVKTFRDAPDALRALFDLERDHPEKDIVLVRADTNEEVRLAFKNYFSDAHDFLKLIDEACTKLTSEKKQLPPKVRRSLKAKR